MSEDQKYSAKIEHLEGMHKVDADLCVKIPVELITQLGWLAEDEVEWEKTEICEGQGVHKGLILSNRSKQFRDADEARRKAISIDME